MRLSVARGRLLVLALLTLAAALWAQPATALSNGMVISQVYGGGGNSGADYRQDYIELFNRGTTPVSLAGWSLQYASATGTGNFGSSSTQITELPAVTIAPGRYFLVREGQGSGGTIDVPADHVDATAINMSGSAGKVALVNDAAGLGCNGGSTPCNAGQLARIVDLVGYGGANFYEGSGPAPALTNTTAALRALQGCAETDDNSADFASGAPSPRNLASASHFCNAESAPSVVSTNPAAGATGVTRSANVTVTFSEPVSTSGEWLTLTCSETGAHPGAISGGPNAFTLDPATDFAFGESCTIAVEGDLVSDQDALDPPDTAADYSATFSVASITPLGTIQGVITDTTDGFTFDSPLVGQNVVVKGVVTQLHRSGNNRGFFIQNTEATDDDNDLTSDGLFVFIGGFDTVLPSPGYRPQVGDEVILSGRVAEFFDLTQLSSPRLEQVVQSFVDLDATVPAFEVAPPSNLADAYRYWERREGMRARIPAGTLTVDGTDRFGLDAEQWVMRTDAPVAAAADPFARRVFRDAHPLDDLPGLFDNGNGYRILIGAGGLKGAANDPSPALTPLRTYETVTNEVVGAVYFSFGKYAVMASENLEATPGVDPSTNTPPAPAADGEYSVSNYNVENLYDFRDDPNDGCDFAGNAGCPGVRPPFDYVPASEETYQKHLTDIAMQITEDLHSPDLILVQEAEDQDICEVAAGALVCGTDDDADGKPDTLQDLALAISAAGGAPYDAAYDRDGRDDRGIVSGFLYRTDRVELLPASASHPVLGESPAVEYRAPGLAYNEDVQNPKALNADLPSDVDTSTGLDGNDVFTRAPQVGLFRFWRNGVGNGTWIDVYAISNHFSSTPTARVGQRTEQANYDAAIVAALGEGARVLVGGDFNVFPRPDDPFVPGDALFPSDQLGAFYDAGLVPMWERIAAEAPVTAYSYVFQGQTQTLDTQFLTPSLADEVVDSRIAHVNADWPADYAGDRARGASDHDPIATRIEVPVTIESLAALLQWCADEGQITGNNTLKQLQHHLDLNQIGPFVNQTLGKTPQFVTEGCSAALVSSAQALG